MTRPYDPKSGPTRSHYFASFLLASLVQQFGKVLPFGRVFLADDS